MNGIETPITRRQLIASTVAAGTSLAGCSSLSGEGKPSTIPSTNSTTTEEPQQHGSSDPLTRAETNLEAAFETLNGITVIEDDTIIYADTGQDPDFLDLYEKLDALDAALETAREEYDSDTNEFRRVKLGATLVERKLLTYNVIDHIESKTLLYTEAIRFVELNGAIGAIDEVFEDVELVTESAHLALDAIEKLRPTVSIHPATIILTGSPLRARYSRNWMSI